LATIAAKNGNYSVGTRNGDSLSQFWRT